jgi:long-chain acyl-CoA synthetase
VSARDLADDVRAWARRLVSGGLQPGDRLAVLSRTRYEWTVVDYAAWLVGCVVVPLYDTASAEQLRHVLQDSGAGAAVVESAAHAQALLDLRSELPALEHVWPLVQDPSTSEKTDPLQSPDLVDDSELEQRRAGVDHSSAATLVYTSGSTGTPQGCRIDHGQLLFASAATAEVLAPVLSEDACTLLFLPLAHVLARLVQVTAIRAGVRLGYAPDMRTLVDDLAAYRPTFLVGVPRVFEKLFTIYSQRAAADGRGPLFDRATDTAIAYSLALETARGPGVVLRARHAVFERLVYRPMREALGGHLTHAIAGGAPLGDRLGHLFRGVGIAVLEGYGLTETTGGTTATAPGDHKVGRVGRPLPGTAVRVSAEGELLVRGPHVFAGYWGDEDATRQAFTEAGWLCTGDLGEIDDEGFVRVTGRLREILVTAGGKNVSPGPLEDAVRAHPLVSQCLVVGDARPFVAALVTLDPEAARSWAESRGRSTDLSALSRDEELLAEVQVAVDRANERVSQAESIRRWAVVPETWSEESGELTPSLKLRRHVVARRHRAVVDDLYLP